MQYEPHNRAVQTIVRDNTYDSVGLIEAANTQNRAHPTNGG